MIEIDVIETPALGDRSYLATDGTVALVIDPQRDFDRVLAVAAERGVAITHVFETHIHNDYVTGGFALAEATGASYHVNAADTVSFARIPVSDGDRIDVGRMRIRVAATPGHTFNHLSYVLEREGEAFAVFTGGSLLYGSTGRTDLLGEAHKSDLAHAQYRSAHRLAGELPDDTLVCPTHGFGSFCSATPTSGTSSTIGTERSLNPALTLDEDDYVETTLANLDVYPAYYAHMALANAAGPLAPDLEPPRRAESGELRRRIDAGEWVVDLRSRMAFAARHMRGTFLFELGDSMATYLGWLIPWGAPLTLIGATPQDVAAAQRDLARIGIDQVRAQATGDPADLAEGEALQSFPVTDFAGYQQASRDREIVLLDVRRDSEWQAARVGGAVHIPLHELARRMAEVPEGEVWIYCRTGYRAAVAASMLDAAGRSVALIDDYFDVAQRIGLAADGAVPAY